MGFGCCFKNASSIQLRESWGYSALQSNFNYGSICGLYLLLVTLNFSFMLDREPTTLIGSNSMSSFDNHHHDRTKILIRYIARIYRSFGMAIPEGSFIDFQTDPPLFGASFRLLAACQLATEGAGNQSLLNSNSQSSHDFLVLGPTPIFVTVEKEGQVTPAQAAAVRPSLLQMTPATYVRLSAVNTFFELLACLLRKQRDLYSASEYLTEPLIAPNRSTKFLQVLFNYCLNAANLHSVIDLVKVSPIKLLFDVRWISDFR